ncbi:MAG: DNA polymerase III subunit gamma/tau [candidate division Zixibacteria bacterium]|nr:DNA polymerase III subunit gamma/tau [candidate division Zixibacteria bacterium]
MAVSDYQVFARRFRPLKFDEVVGQEAVTRTLANAVAGGRVAQAYLFAGPRGVGKTSVARILAKALNCATGPTVTPCGVCDNCRAIAAGNDTDVLEIDGASNRGIDDVRELRERVRFAPGHSPRKIYIIDEVHMLTPEAFNALLKTLEEPPSHVVFVFATTRLDKVPPTIVSRCQRFIFRRIGTAAIEGKLRAIAEGEGLNVEPRALSLIARRAAGSMRDGESMFDQVIAFAGEKISLGDVERTLGLVAGEAVENLAGAVLAGDGAAALRAVDALVRDGADLVQAAHQLVEYLRDLMVLAAAPDDVELVDVSGEEREKLRATAAEHSPATLLNLINVFLEATGPMGRVLSPRLVLEYAALKAARIRNLLPIEDLLRVSAGAEEGAPAAGEGAAKPASEAAAELAKSLTETWQRVLTGLAQRDRALHALVAPARLVSFTGDELRLGFPENYRASAEKVEQGERRAALAQELGAILGRPVSVRVQIEEGAPAAAPVSTLFEDMPLVSEIRRRYGGEIVEEREITGPEGEDP